MSELIGFGKNDKKIMSGGDLVKYKGEKGRKDIISLCWFFLDEDGNPIMGKDATPKMTAADIHYIPGMGYILDNDYLNEKLGAPKRKIGTFVVHYRTDRHGKPQKPFEYDVKPWQFGEDKYRRLADIHTYTNLTENDIAVSCEDDTFQKLQFTGIPGGAMWQKKESIKADVLDTVKNMQHRLSLGRKVELADLKDHYNESEEVSTESYASTDYDDLMDGIE